MQTVKQWSNIIWLKTYKIRTVAISINCIWMLLVSIVGLTVVQLRFFVNIYNGCSSYRFLSMHVLPLSEKNK